MLKVALLLLLTARCLQQQWNGSVERLQKVESESKLGKRLIGGK
jgi:hypothetical protein